MPESVDFAERFLHLETHSGLSPRTAALKKVKKDAIISGRYNASLQNIDKVLFTHHNTMEACAVDIVYRSLGLLFFHDTKLDDKHYHFNEAHKRALRIVGAPRKSIATRA